MIKISQPKIITTPTQLYKHFPKPFLWQDLSDFQILDEPLETLGNNYFNVPIRANINAEWIKGTRKMHRMQLEQILALLDKNVTRFKATLKRSPSGKYIIEIRDKTITK